jgi:hypothetical protein
MKAIKGVELFAVGTWRGVNSPLGGDRYTREDLEAMVQAFNQGAMRPKIKITHGSDREQVDIGEVVNLRLEDNRLVGDFVNLDENLYQLMRKGLFRRRSAEILWNMRDKAGRLWRRVVKAVALLAPGQKPAVSLAEGYQFERAYCYELTNKDDNVSSVRFEVDRLCKNYVHSGEAENYERAIELVRKNHTELWNFYMKGA